MWDYLIFLAAFSHLGIIIGIFRGREGPSVSSYTISSIHHLIQHFEFPYTDLQEHFLICIGFRRCTSKQYLAIILWGSVYLLEDRISLFISQQDAQRVTMVVHFWQMNSRLWYAFQEWTIYACYISFIAFLTFLFVLFIHLPQILCWKKVAKKNIHRRVFIYLSE